MLTEKQTLHRLRSLLSPERFTHTLSVARWAEQLAKIHGEDPARARLAGVLHDCAKEKPGTALAAYVRTRRLAVPDKALIFRWKRFSLFHAYVSADLASKDFAAKDRAVLNAIARHTLGHPAMSRLDKILFVADFSAPQRSFAAAVRLRQLARRDLESAFRETVRLKMFYVLKRGEALHPMMVKMWNDRKYEIRNEKD